MTDLQAAPNKNRKPWTTFAALLALSGALGMGYAVDDARAQGDTAAPASAPVVQTPATRDAANLQSAFSVVARAIEPSVVTIRTTRSTPAPRPGASGPGSGRDPFEEFFRRFRDFGFGPGVLPNVQQPEYFTPAQGGGLGSGFVYRADGIILTNAHVVRGADRVTVELSDGREFKNARVLGTDARTDIAVVKVEANNLPVAKLGDSSNVNVGDWAIAVGNPFGLAHTVTVGVISAKAREVPLSEAGPGDYLQTDASINPGNSGGPLLDIYGRVIGINNAIYSQSGGNIGIGFAIPINTAREIADILIKEGRVRRARIGVAIANIEDRAAAFGLAPDIKGVLVESVDADGPGAKAGLQPGDVITHFNGQAVTRSLDLQQLVSRSGIGSQAQLRVLRGGNTITLTAQLEELTEEKPSTPPAPVPEGTEATTLGLRLSTLTPELSQRFGISGSRGVVVVGLQPNSAAARAGVQVGDVIERVGQSPVTSPETLQSAVQSIIGRQTGAEKIVALYINRRGQRSYVMITVAQ